MKISSIEDLMKSAEVDIREKKYRLSKIESEVDFDIYLVAQLRREIKSQEEVLNGCRSRVRDKKLDKLGL